MNQMLENVSMTIFLVTINSTIQCFSSPVLVMEFCLGYNVEKMIACLFLIIGEILERGPGAEIYVMQGRECVSKLQSL